jgi:hypothetical protein
MFDLQMAQLGRACTRDNPLLRPSMRSIVVALMTLSSPTEDCDDDSSYENQSLINLLSVRWRFCMTNWIMFVKTCRKDTTNGLYFICIWNIAVGVFLLLLLQFYIYIYQDGKKSSCHMDFL